MRNLQKTAAVRISGLTRSFGGPKILDGLDLELAPGSFTALLGRSGSGKSTLLRTLAGLDAAPAGAVSVPARRAVVFQEPRLLPWKRVEANVTLGLRSSDAKTAARDALAEVQLTHRSDAWPLTLSGGEASRAALARSLVRRPQLLLLDEPFAALDALTRMKMQELVLKLWRDHRPAVLLVTHDVDEALLLAERAVVLANGSIAADLDVAMAYPRDPTAPEFGRLRHRLLQELGVEAEESQAADAHVSNPSNPEFELTPGDPA